MLQWSVKPEVGFAWHAASFLDGRRGAIREKTSLYGTILNGLQDVFGRICGTGRYAMRRKKMFFSQMKSFGWDWVLFLVMKYKNELVVWNRVNVSGEKICGIHLKRTFLCRKNGMVIAFCYQDYSKHIIFLFGAINRISVFRLIFRWNKSLSLNKRATGIRYALNIKFIYRWME